MVFCSIAQCGNSSATCNSTNKGITFHRFPQDADTKDKWISATGKRNWFPTTNSRICSLHFTEDYYNNSTKRRTLFKDAVPTVNTWKLINELAKEESKSSVPDSPETSSALSSPSCSRKHTQRLQATSTDNQQTRTDDFDPTVTDTQKERKLRAEVNQQKRVIKKQQLKIKSLQCKTRRYRKTILRLKDLIKKIEHNRFVREDQECVLENENITAPESIDKQKLESGKNVTDLVNKRQLLNKYLHFTGQ